MESNKIDELIDLLDENLQELSEALDTFASGSLQDSALKLPIIDRAQLYVLCTYAIESLLFSHLRLDGVNTKEHPIFQELTRVKQYFAKIQNAESTPAQPERRVDKAAAARFVKSAIMSQPK